LTFFAFFLKKNIQSLYGSTQLTDQMKNWKEGQAIPVLYERYLCGLWNADKALWIRPDPERYLQQAASYFSDHKNVTPTIPQIETLMLGYKGECIFHIYFFFESNSPKQPREKRTRDHGRRHPDPVHPQKKTRRSDRSGRPITRTEPRAKLF
jgi:hypothetical protein